MSRFPNRFTFLLTLFLALAGCSDTPSIKGPANTIIAFSNNENVYVLNTDKGLLKTLIGDGYYQARISPDKTRVACIYLNDFYITILNLDGNFDVDGKPKQVYNTQAQSSGSGLSHSHYPTWSVDGNKLYFTNANHLVVYDYQEKHTTVLFDFPENQTGGWSYESGNMALSKGGDALYCMLSDGPEKFAFWKIDLNTNQGSLVTSATRESVLSFSFSPGFPDELIEALFGSRENPVLGPIHSSDDRYFFYVDNEKGFLAKHLLMVYDKTLKTRSEVVTLETSLYSK